MPATQLSLLSAVLAKNPELSLASASLDSAPAARSPKVAGKKRR